MINSTTYSLIPVRRDGQISSITIGGGGGGGSAVGSTSVATGGGVTYTAGYAINISGTTISVICGTFLPVNNPVATGTLKAPIISGGTCIVTPILLANTCVCSPFICASSCLTTPFLGVGTTAPQKTLHLSQNQSGGNTIAAFEDTNTTNGNGPLVSFRGTTTGTGGATFQELAGFQATFVDHNHATRKGDFNVFSIGSGTEHDLTFDNAGNTKMPAFQTGYNGRNWQISESGDAEFQNLRVRNSLTAYQLDINKINSINGGLVISQANGTALCTGGTKIYFDEDNGNKQIQFQVGDIIKGQQWTGRGIGSYIGRVCTVCHSNTFGCAYIDTVSACVPYSQTMELVQYGSCCDVARQNLIYLTASDSCNPYMSVITCSTTGINGVETLRLGNLCGITDACFGGALSGYGLYANNVYLKGQIQIAASSSGYANMTDKPTCLASINSTEASKLTGIEAGATVGATSAQVTAIASAACTACWGNIASIPSPLATPSGAGLFLNATAMGYYCGGAWQTCIDCSGCAKFTNVVEFGTGTAPINLGNGYGAVAIKGNEIWENTQNGVGTLIISYRGFQGGLTQPRITAIGDGQGNSVASFAASGTEIFGGLRIDGSTLAIGTITSNSTMTATNFILSSDERLKQCIQPINIKPINVDYKEFELCNDAGQKRYGIIAQEIEKQYPELIHKGADGMLGVSYNDLFVREIASLKCEVKELKLQLNYMRNYNC
jgi:hypothetical protein